LALQTSSVPAAQDYPLNGPAMANIRLHYEGTVCVCSGAHPEDEGWFKFKSGVGDSLNGGWMRIEVLELGAPAEAWLDDDFTFFPMGFSYARSFRNNVPQALRDQFHVSVEMIQKPSQDRRPELQRESYTQPYPTTSDIIMDPADQVAPITNTQYGGDAASWVFHPGTRPRWIETDLTLRIKVWPDPSVVDTRLTQAGVPFVYEIPLQTKNDVLFQLSPFILPIAIIGQPPGDLSWSQLTESSGQGASLAVYEQQGSSRTVQDSWGIGPFSHTGPEIRNHREDGQGVSQILSAQQSLSIRTNTPYGIGQGDIMVVIRRPSFEQWESYRDLDFRLIDDGVPTLTAFPMKAFLQPGLNPMVDMLSADEKQALADINPLLRSKHARLSEPR
jgi:hypothetical protein